MQARVGLAQIVVGAVMIGDIAVAWKSDPRIFRAFGKRVSRWELGPEIGFRLLFETERVSDMRHGTKQMWPIEDMSLGSHFGKDLHSPLTTV